MLPEDLFSVAIKGCFLIAALKFVDAIAMVVLKHRRPTKEETEKEKARGEWRPDYPVCT